jgi:hypothetical protein
MSFDTLKQSESNPADFSAFTDEQVDAVVIYLAKIARVTRAEHGLSAEQNQAHIKKFFAIMDSWPAEFRQRIQDRVMEAGKEYEKTRKPNFWVVPADAMIAATKAVELG